MDKNILIFLILAQINSDAGKDIFDSGLVGIIRNRKYKKILRYIQNFGYANKDIYIKKAMDLINKSKHSNFRYYVYIPEYGMNIVYFNFHINGVKYQCSFHSFSSFNMRGKNTKYVTSWDEKSSRVALYRAAKVYGL